MKKNILIAVSALMLGAAGLFFASNTEATQKTASCCCKDCASCCGDNCNCPNSACCSADACCSK
ncbi:MAG TPA: hypothetical protein VIX80_02625 [Candidatus Kapabacteria bacterium]